MRTPSITLSDAEPGAQRGPAQNRRAPVSTSGDGSETRRVNDLLMTLLGSLGTVFGSVVGAFIVVGLENYLAQLGARVTVVQGIIFVVCVLTFRRGVIGELSRVLKKPL